ncbi:MAG: acyltransferase [Deltaproteobacteria bacterium]|nr:acyltransferase [Deltaproteobacteria bacterium]
MARNDALDAARAIAMVLVVATHTALSFMVTPIGWAVQDRSQHLGVDLAVWIVRAFVMPMFFWLSGYFSRELLDVRGLRGYVRHRVVRILIPLALALVPCSLLLGAEWDWGREVIARPGVAENIPKLQSSELPIFLGHLWYLYYLLLLSVAAVVIARIARATGIRIPMGIGVLAVPALLTFGVLASLRSVHTDTPLGFVPDAPIAIFMGGYFAWGWIVRGRPDELPRYERYAWHALAIALVLLVAVITTLYDGLDAITHAPLHASAASALFAIAVMIGFLGLCVRHGRRHPLLRLASESSYWCYIAHVPIVVALQILVAPIAVPGIFKLPAIVIVTSAVCMGSYALLLRLNTPRSHSAHR